MAWFDNNKRLMCPCCHKPEGVRLVRSRGDNHYNKHENNFVCRLCQCEFTVEYRVWGIEIIEEGEKNDSNKI